MWGRILEKYDPRGKDTLFKSVSALYALEKFIPESIIDYTSCACRLFSGVQEITFNTMENLFVTVNANRDLFGTLVDRFRYGNPEAVHTSVDRIKKLLEFIESHSRVIDGPQTPNPSALRSSAPRLDASPSITSLPSPKSDSPKQTVPTRGTHSRYPPS